MTTVKQMKNRMNSAHQTILTSIRDGKMWINHRTSPAEYRGFRSAFTTLLRWGAVEQRYTTDTSGRRVFESAITKTGLDLLA